MTARRDCLRMLDANGNRAAEGLRVLEDIARFVCDDQPCAALAKQLRHQVRHLVPSTAVESRDVGGDVGVGLPNPDAARARLVELIRANAARVQEAMRAAEEAARLVAPASVAGLEAIRYRCYELESRLLSRLPAWLLHRIRLYVLVDTTLCGDPLRIAEGAAKGGAGAIQLRAKALSPRAYRELAARVQEVVKASGALFIVNDHAAVARVLSADGIHVGQDDLAIADVRQVVGPACAVGISAHTPEQVWAGVAQGADYCGLGPMYPTATKPHEPCRGPHLLDAVKADLRLPSYAIGGMDAQRIRELRGRVPHGVAVARVVCQADDPEQVTSDLHRLIEPEEA